MDVDVRNGVVLSYAMKHIIEEDVMLCYVVLRVRFVRLCVML